MAAHALVYGPIPMNILVALSELSIFENTSQKVDKENWWVG